MLHSDSETYETDEYLRNQIVPRFPSIHDDQAEKHKQRLCLLRRCRRAPWRSSLLATWCHCTQPSGVAPVLCCARLPGMMRADPPRTGGVKSYEDLTAVDRLLPRAWPNKRREHAAYYERCIAEVERHRAQLAVGTQSQEACREAFDLLSECLAVSKEDYQTLSATMTQVEDNYVAQAARVLQLTESVQQSRELLAQTVDALVASEAERDADGQLARGLEHKLQSVARCSLKIRAVNRAVAAWRRCAAHRVSRRHQLRKALRRLQHMAIGCAYRRWLQY
eukprot:COSAG02_NODE_2044_length_10022_cov_81.942558_1_plen_278_part_10